ncbi:MAG: acyl--CoA ligase [Bacilli bacterium]|nr:acyl--CoA ligase [Bacilli bacterium]
MLKSILLRINKFVSDVLDKITKKEPWYKYYDKGDKINYPDLTIYELIAKTAEMYPNNYAFLYYGKKISYREFLIRIKKTASALLELGVKEGDRVTICMPNTPVAIITFYAINMIGATASMIHPLSSENEIEFYLNEASSKHILTIDLVYDKLMKVIDKTKVENIIVSSVSDDMNSFMHFMYWFFNGRKNKIVKNEKSIFYKDFIKKGIYIKEFECAKRGQDDEAVILYSGGTTGSPKGIVLTNLNFNALAMQCHLMCHPAKAGDSILAILPIFHGFGLGVSIHTPLYIGMQVILVPDFSPRKFGSLIKKYKPNFITGVPTLYEALLKTKLGKNDLSSLTCVVSGGDTLIPSFKKKIDEFLLKHGSKTKVRCGYGLTESTGASCLNPKNEYRDNSIGIPLPDMLYKIVKIGTLTEANTMEDGEICINGPTVMKGYLNNPEETNKTLVKHPDGKVWLHTGDIGCMDKDGFIYFKQRLKRLIVSSGYNIYPSYVEDIICSHPLVDQAVVIGIPHEYKKQVAKAYIVLKKGEKPSISTKKKIKKYCEEKLSKYSWPYEYEFRDSLPTTLVGKVAYKKLEEENNKKGE